MSPTRVSLRQIEEGETLRELVRWYKENKNNFTRRLNVLRDKSRDAFEKAGYGPKDIERIITEVRQKSANNK